ncbi:MAG: MBL fold metallo-hydrolase [Hyphomicrobiaceae bacterium]
MKLTVVGCGDAFGSGGRLQTSFHVETDDHRFLIDCGATVMIGLNRLGLDPNAIDTVFVSHLHGDHFSGLIWMLLHGQHIAKRTAPLTVIGPAGIRDRFVAAAEALFPDATKVKPRFEMHFQEYAKEVPLSHRNITLTAFEVSHPSGAMSAALRLETAGKCIAFTGDTEWVESLVPAGRNADLYIMECFAYAGPTRYHLDWKTIAANLPRIGAKRILLSHMSEAMLARRNEAAAAGAILADDGFVIKI